MAYNIVQCSVTEFIDSNIKLPRFQRKQSWGPEDNFKLCISVFKGYPVGVVIINQNKEAEWLLDGRQRRNALMHMRENYVEVYNWATKFVRISPTDSNEVVRDKFWKRIDIYLQKEFDDNKKKTDINLDSVNDDELDYEEDTDTDSFDSATQYQSLKTLLEIILLVHGKKVQSRTHFEQMFMFNNIVPPNALHCTTVVNGNYECDPAKVRRRILDAIDDNAIDAETFHINFLKRDLDKEKEHMLQQYVETHWEYYKNCIEVVKNCKSVFLQAKIGMIKLTNATVLDAQNIFSLINAGGTKLTAEELLSARPFWNVKVLNPSGEVRDEVIKLYRKLEIDPPTDVYRWDFGATLLSRIDKNHLIFEELPLNKDSKDSTFNKRMALGFKTLSAIYLGGITNNHVTALERKDINWDVDIDNLINELNTVISVVSDAEYFRYFSQWNHSIMNLTTNAVAQEFLVILYEKWKKYGRPLKMSANGGNQLCKDAVVLFDRLVYEYTIGLWRSASDGRLANDIEHLDERLKPIPEKDWVDLLEELKNGTYKGKGIKHDSMKGILFHYCAIKKFMPHCKSNDTIFEIDHIIAQNLFKNNRSSLVSGMLINSIANLSPLPKGSNIAKLDKPLNHITDEWLLKELKEFTGLSDNDIVKYSDITNIKGLIEKRMKMLIEAFTTLRQSLLANNQ